ncbi:hypothetical protein GCM10027093_15940 [Paraburkholderia jirisanensis]
MRLLGAAARTVATLCFGARAHIARDVAAQVTARRWRRELVVTRFSLLPRLYCGGLVRLPVPALRPLLGYARRGKRRNDNAAQKQH